MGSKWMLGCKKGGVGGDLEDPSTFAITRFKVFSEKFFKRFDSLESFSF